MYYSGLISEPGPKITDIFGSRSQNLWTNCWGTRGCERLWTERSNGIKERTLTATDNGK